MALRHQLISYAIVFLMHCIVMQLLSDALCLFDFPTAKARLYEVTGYHSLQRIDLDSDDFLVDFSPSFAGARGAECCKFFAGDFPLESVENTARGTFSPFPQAFSTLPTLRLGSRFSRRKVLKGTDPRRR